MARVPGVAIREGNMIAGRERKTFASLAGAWIEQEIVEAGGGIEATAVNDSEMQQRSYPNSFGGQSVTGGFEAVRALGLADHAQETAELAVALLDAPQCPSGEMDVILDSTQVALQIHESCGHPTELDRVFGTEASFAGTSFLTTDKLDQLRYGSDLVSIDADATAPGGLGTFGYDDEGVPAQKRAADRPRDARRLPDQPRDRAADRPAQHGQRARLDVEQHPADPHDEHQSASRRRGQPRRPHRRYRATASS